MAAFQGLSFSRTGRTLHSPLAVRKAKLVLEASPFRIELQEASESSWRRRGAGRRDVAIASCRATVYRRAFNSMDIVSCRSVALPTYSIFAAYATELLNTTSSH